jgi:hypothetical protein
VTTANESGRESRVKMDREGIQAWIYEKLTDEVYPLGLMREGLGWVSEERLQKIAEAKLDTHIIFLVWVYDTGEED